jgi:ATP-dependent DNA helicase RecQ
LDPRLAYRNWVADPDQVVLSWPGNFPATAPIHKATAAPEIGSLLQLRPRSDGKAGCEVADPNGIAVSRMAQNFAPPAGEILEVRVAAILARKAREGDAENLRCKNWELVLPEITYAAGHPR